MQANKVSPASLCSNTLPGHPEMNVLSGRGLKSGSGGELESQPSQASLFGSEPMPNSMELFSQPYPSHSSSVSQHSQPHSSSHTIQHNGTQHSQDDDGRGIQSVQPDRTSGKQISGGHNRYYMRYLSTMSSALSDKRQGGEAADYSTPVDTSGRQGDTAHSKAAFEAWKSRQQDKLEKQRLIEDVVSTSTLGYTKELKQTLENLRKEIKEALNPCNAIEKGHTEKIPNSELCHLLQGQEEIKEQLNDLQTLYNQQMAEIAALKMQVSALERHQTATLQSTLSTEISKLEKTLVTPYLHRLEEYLSQLSEQLKAYSRKSLPANTKEAENTQTECTVGTPYTITHVRTQCKPESQCSGGSQSKQIKRRRKSSSVTRDHQSLTDKAGDSVGGGGGVRSQGDLSSSFDIDLTQCSPSGCSQVISSSVQRPTTSSVSHTASHRKKAQQSVSPSVGPGTKRKRTNGRVGKRRGTGGKRGVLATPKPTRRSGRLSKTNTAPTEQAPPSIGSDEQLHVHVCVKPELEVKVHNGGSSGNVATSGGDVLEDWLDFKPPQVFADTKTPSQTHNGIKFQRSSEAAKRRLAITEQMSSTLAGSDSVLRELLHSSSSLHSP